MFIQKLDNCMLCEPIGSHNVADAHFVPPLDYASLAKLDQHNQEASPAFKTHKPLCGFMTFKSGEHPRHYI